MLIPRINTPDGLFHNGNPQTGDPGTIVTAEWLNAVQQGFIEIRDNKADKALLDNKFGEVKKYVDNTAMAGCQVEVGGLADEVRYNFIRELTKQGDGSGNVTQGFCEIAATGELYTLHSTQDKGVLNLFVNEGGVETSVAYSTKSNLLGHQQLGCFTDTAGNRWFIASANKSQADYGAKVVVFQINREGASLSDINHKHWQLFPTGTVGQNTTPAVSLNGDYLVAEISDANSATIRVFDLIALSNRGNGDYSNDYLVEFSIDLPGSGYPLQGLACDGSVIYVFLGYGQQAGKPLRMQLYTMNGLPITSINTQIGHQMALADGDGSKWEMEGANWISAGGTKKLAVNIASKGFNRLWLVDGNATIKGYGNGERPGFLSVGKNDFAVPAGEAMRMGHWDGEAFKERLSIKPNGQLSELPASAAFVDANNTASPTPANLDVTPIGNLFFINCKFSDLDTTGMADGNSKIVLTGLPAAKRRTALSLHMQKCNTNKQLVATIDSNNEIIIHEIKEDNASVIVNVEQLAGATVVISGTYLARTE